MNMNASIQFIYRRLRCLHSPSNVVAQIAQLVEQRTENPRVTGSIPVLGTKVSKGTILFDTFFYGLSELQNWNYY